MVYKYEQKINEAFFRANRAGGNVNNELLAELQEVYRKAKAFDEVIEIYARCYDHKDYNFIREIDGVVDRLVDTFEQEDE